VARARLDWLKRMPEMAGGGEGEGGGNSRLHRESLGQLGTNNNNNNNLFLSSMEYCFMFPSLLFYILRKIFLYQSSFLRPCFLYFKLRSRTFGSFVVGSSDPQSLIMVPDPDPTLELRNDT
jgi:hypothetical protein